METLSSLIAAAAIGTTGLYPVAAIGPDGTQQVVAVGSTDSGLTVHTLTGEATDLSLELYQDGTLRLVPRADEGKAIKLADADPTGPTSAGIVPIPEHYIYNPNAWRTGYHDYCTSSPDFYLTPDLSADFRGACANHDMCMEDLDYLDHGVGWCNAALLLDMRAVCHSVYVGELEKHQQGCRDTAELYYRAVTLANWERF